MIDPCEDYEYNDGLHDADVADEKREDDLLEKLRKHEKTNY